MNETESEIIGCIKENTTGSVIAGGYLRDQLLGLPHNDIDVFVTQYNIHSKHITTLLRRKGYKCVRDCSEEYTGEFLSYRIEGTSINIIIVPTPPKDWVINRFDAGICMVYFDIDSEKLITTPQFEKDRENKTITLYPCNMNGPQLEKSVMYRVPKLVKHLGNEYTPKMSWKGLV